MLLLYGLCFCERSLRAREEASLSSFCLPGISLPSGLSGLLVPRSARRRNCGRPRKGLGGVTSAAPAQNLFWCCLSCVLPAATVTVAVMRQVQVCRLRHEFRAEGLGLRVLGFGVENLSLRGWG